jgi:multisubunit Na+/H+ antiporter MnhB subunit
MNSVGRRIGFLLPITFGSTAKNYEFEFQVDSVKRIPWKNYKPFQRIPEPPSPKHQVSGLDNVTTAIITVGILGFSAYVLSVKKSTPSE